MTAQPAGEEDREQAIAGARPRSAATTSWREIRQSKARLNAWPAAAVKESTGPEGAAEVRGPGRERDRSQPPSLKPLLQRNLAALESAVAVANARSTTAWKSPQWRLPIAGAPNNRRVSGVESLVELMAPSS